jgi:hypothetical protein
MTECRQLECHMCREAGPEVWELECERPSVTQGKDVLQPKAPRSPPDVRQPVSLSKRKITKDGGHGSLPPATGILISLIFKHLWLNTRQLWEEQKPCLPPSETGAEETEKGPSANFSSWVCPHPSGKVTPITDPWSAQTSPCSDLCEQWFWTSCMLSITASCFTVS